MPITIRPFVTSCIVAYQLAVTVGSRMPGFVTQWPSFSFCVPAATSGSVANDSCQRMCESYVQPYSKPWRSASCISSTSRVCGGSGITVTPNFIRPMKSPGARADQDAPRSGRGARHERQSVEHGHDDQQRAVADRERPVLEEPADHRPEQVRAEGRRRGRRLAEPLREDQVREEDRP